MQITAFSDTHGYLPRLTKKTDVVVICGDIIPLDIQQSAILSAIWLKETFLPYLESLPCGQVVWTWGNHDFLGEWMMRDPEIVKGYLGLSDFETQKIHLLVDEGFEYEGHKFWGSPWIGVLRNWAFYDTPEGLAEHFALIPENIDVLLTHAAPKIRRFGKICQRDAKGFGKDCGSIELAAAAFHSHPKLHVFGHIHSGSHTPLVVEETKFCNVSILDEKYQKHYLPAHFEI